MYNNIIIENILSSIFLTQANLNIAKSYLFKYQRVIFLIGEGAPK